MKRPQPRINQIKYLHSQQPVLLFKLGNGWAAGGGIEYAITDTILGRIEYRYTDLQASGFVNVPANIADGGTRTPISDFRVGFAYKFGG